MKKLILVFVVYIVFSIQPIFANQQDSLLEKIQRLEKNESLIEKIYEFRHSELKQEFTTAKEELKDENSTNRLLLVVFGSLSVAVIIAAIYEGKKFIDEKVKEQLSKLLDTEKEKIERIIDNHDEETQIKKRSNILVVSKREITPDFMKFFRKLDFKKIEYKMVSEVTDNSYRKKFDLILINNEDESFTTKEQIEELMTENQDQVYFVLSDKFIKFDDRSRIGTANSRITMYHQLMSTLKYQLILQKT